MTFFGEKYKKVMRILLILGIVLSLFSMVTAMLSMHVDENADNRDLYVIMGTNLVMFWVFCAELGRSFKTGDQYQMSGGSILILFLTSVASIVFSVLRIDDLKKANSESKGRLMDMPTKTSDILNYCILSASGVVCAIAIGIAYYIMFPAQGSNLGRSFTQ